MFLKFIFVLIRGKILLPLNKMQRILAIFDLDGTLTTEYSSWEYLLRRINKWTPFGKNNLESYLAGTLTGVNEEEQYVNFCQLDAQLLKGLSYNEYISILNEIPFRNNINALMKYLHSIGAYTVIITAGFAELAERAKKMYKFDTYVANYLESSQKYLNGNVIVNVGGWYGKGKIVKQIRQELDTETSFVLAFGDSSGDIEMFSQAGLSFAMFEADTTTIGHAVTYLDDFSKAQYIIEKYFKKI